MSADTPANADAAKPPRVDHPRPAEPDHGRPAERAPKQQQAEAGRSQQPARTLNRADYNAARHAEPPIKQQSDGNSRAPADALTPAASSANDRRAEPVAPRHANDAATRGPQGAETLNRADYNAGRYAEPPIRSHETADAQRRDNVSRQRTELEPAGASGARPTGSALEAGPGHRPDAGHEARQERNGGTEQAPDSAARKPADESAATRNPDRSDLAVEGKSRTSEPSPDGHPAITHFYGEFKGQRTDLYTDGTRWVPGDLRQREAASAGRGELPDDSPTGQDLVESAGEESSRLEKIRRELYEDDDVMDIVSENTNVWHNLFTPPQTNSYETVPAPGPHFSAQQHTGMDVGTGATALFALGLAIDRVAKWGMQHFEKHQEGD